ncbi:PREDICTED: sperm flagellar protein 2-like [Acropora digitifera]|uniref:sperm flagellar protein 2-like n=1 Tax=Acropora digitifera TaxID=70779 RepID=UPI00077B0FA2|nr:PREDICTED: sperm flagellar protein 2-like [Acropora digitifera]
MTDILCRWLNEDVRLSRIIDPSNIAREFSTGYLLGELLNKHGLQEDFSFFSQNSTADSKLHNFTLLEPTLKLLEVPYDTNVARSLMNQNHSAITRLTYQLFIALGKKSSRQAKQKQLEMMDKIRGATVVIPKPPESKRTGKSRAEMRRLREAEEVKESIDAFEASLRAVIPPTSPMGFEGESNRDGDAEMEAFRGSKSPKKAVDPLSYIKPSSNDDYINKIRTRLEEDAVARKEREKRRRRVLIEQMKAHEAQEEAHREEMLVNRLMRQSQQERRIAVQLMQELCRQARIEYAEETRKAQELQDKIKAEIAEAKYNKHYGICWEMLSQIVDFSCKVGEYRELTEERIPPKMFREWKALFLEGIPIYQDEPIEDSSTDLAKQKEIEREKEELMDEGDFLEYKNLIGEWTPGEESEIQGPAKDNAVLGHIIHRLFKIVAPPEVPVNSLLYTVSFSGHRMIRLSVDDLVAEAVDAFKNNECIEETPDETPLSGESVSPKKVIIKDQAIGESLNVTPHSAGVDERTGESQETEDGNKMDETQTSEGTESEEKRDKTKEELEKESTEAKEDEKKSLTNLKELEPVPSKTKGPTVTSFLSSPNFKILVVVRIKTVNVRKGLWLLEKALSGYDAQKEAKDAKAAKEPTRVGKSKKSRLAPDPHPSPEVNGGACFTERIEKQVPFINLCSDSCSTRQPSATKRIVGFAEAWPKLEKWFSKFGILQRVDANTSQEELYDEVSALLNETYQKLIAPPEETPSEPVVTPGQSAEGEPAPGPQTTQGETPPTEGIGGEGAVPPAENVPTPAEAPSEAGTKSEVKSAKSKGESKPGSPKSRKSKKDRSPSPPTSKKGAKSRSPTPPSSRKGSRSGSKSPSASRKGGSRPGSKASRPGSKSSRPGSKRAKSASMYSWILPVFKILTIDLCDRLYDICDNRKELAEKERQSVMNEGWMEDRLGLLTNFYITLMQAEVDRYQDTVRLLKDYYIGMEGKIPSEAISDYARLPLVELPVTVRPQSASSKSGASESTGNLATVEKTEVKSPTSKKEKGTKTPEPVETQEEEPKSRIPLVPRRPKSGEPGTGKGKDKKADKKKGQSADVDKPDTPVPPSDLDEKLVFDAYMVGLTIIETLALIDQTEQEAEAIRQAELEKEKEREALQKKAKDKKDKKGRKSPGKGGSPSKTETPPPPPQEEQEGQSEEEQLKQKTKERARKEFLGAVASEDNGLKTRLEMIKNHAISVLQELKGKAESTYKDMDDWLGQRFLQEVERDSRTFKTPMPPPPPSPIEVPLSDTFTLSQLMNLHQQLLARAPSGVISNRAFCDTILEIATLTVRINNCFMASVRPSSYGCAREVAKHERSFRVDLWFYGQEELENPKDPDVPPVFDRQGKLKDAFFQIFADHNDGALTLDYVDMLLYFAADPDPLEGFLRALSVVANQPMPATKSLHRLPQSMADEYGGDVTIPHIQYYLNLKSDVAPDCFFGCSYPRAKSLSSVVELYVSRQFKDSHSSYAGTRALFLFDAIYRIELCCKTIAKDKSFGVLTVQQVFHHGEGRHEDTHRLSITADPDDTFARERLAGVFVELGAEETEAVPFHLLCQHPIIQDCMHMCQRFKAIERLAGVFVELGAEETEAVPFHLLCQHPIIQDCLHMCQRFKAIDLRNCFKSSSLDSLE